MKVFNCFVCTMVAVVASVSVSILCAPMAHAQSPTPSNFLRLTPNVDSQVSSAWYTNPNSDPSVNPVPLAGGFSTTFTMKFSNPGGIGAADGIVFLVQNGSFNVQYGDGLLDSSSGIYALGPSNGLGGQLGYTGLTNSVGVQFDTYCNGEYGDTCNTGAANPFSSADEVSVQSCGASANTSAHGACTFGTIDLTTLTTSGVATPIYLADGNPHTATITYTPPPSPTSPSTCTPGLTRNSGPCGSLTVVLDTQTVLTVPFDLGYLGLDASGDAYPGFTAATGGGNQDQDILSWNFNWGDPSFSYPLFPTSAATGLQINGNAQLISTVVQTIGVSTPPDIKSSINPNEGTIIYGEIDYVTSQGNSNVNYPLDNADLTSVTANIPISQGSQWPSYAAQIGPLYGSLCDINAGNGGDYCSYLEHTCVSVSSGKPPSDLYCPSLINTDPANNYVALTNEFNWGTSLPTPNPGTTFSLLHFTPSAFGEVLSPTTSVCPQVAPVYSGGQIVAPAKCDTSDVLVVVTGDQTTKRGSSPKGSSLIGLYNVGKPSITYQVTCPGMGQVTLSQTAWYNGNCQLGFLLSPANDLSNGNNLAAPIAFLIYGFGTPPTPQVGVPTPGAPGAKLPLNNPLPNCTMVGPCNPLPWETGPLFSFNQYLQDGGGQTIYDLEQDTFGITDKIIQLSGGQYTTSYNSMQVSLDSIPPTVTATFTSNGVNYPNGSTIPAGYPVTFAYSCADSVSGLSTCGTLSTIPACPLAPNMGTPSATSSPVPVTSSPVGTYTLSTVTSTDCALNPTQVIPSYTISAPQADVGILGTALTNTAAKVTYGAAALDLTKANPAYDVSITFTITASAAGVVGGQITGIWGNSSNCTLAGCPAPSGGPACTTSPANTVNVTSAVVTCYVGTLASIYQLKGAGAAIAIPIASNPPAKATIGITASVSSANDPNPKNNMTPTTTLTVK